MVRLSHWLILSLPHSLDLKPENLLLFEDKTFRFGFLIKLCDFSFARTLSPGDRSRTYCGTPIYMVRPPLVCVPLDQRYSWLPSLTF